MCGGSHDETAVAVSSVAFNMAGPYAKRGGYVPSQTVGAVVANESSISGSVINSLLEGPGIRLKSFARWARANNYRDVIGTPSGKLDSVAQIDPQMIADIIQAEIHEPLVVTEARIERDSIGYWVLKYVFNNHPEKANSAYTYAYDPGSSVATITWVDNTTIAITIPSVSTTGMFLLARYATLGPIQPITDPEPINNTIIPEGENYPLELQGWITLGHTSSSESETLYTVVETEITYSDLRPKEESTDTSDTIENYTKNLYSRQLLKQWPNQEIEEGILGYLWYDNYYDCVETFIVKPVEIEETYTEDIGGGVIKTTTVRTTTDTLVKQLSYTGFSTVVQPRYYDSYHLWEYKLGTGKPNLDSLFSVVGVEGEYIPFIPVRTENQFVSERFPSTVLPEVKKAMRRVYNSKYIELEKNLAKNGGIEDIDYAYVTFGASINSRSMAIKKYLFEFFHRIYISYNASNPLSFEQWQRQFDAAYARQLELEHWYATRPSFAGWYAETPASLTWIPFPSGAYFDLTIQSNTSNVFTYDQKITGSISGLQTGVGLGWAGAKVNQVNIENLSKTDVPSPFYATSAETKAKLLEQFLEDVNGVGIGFSAMNRIRPRDPSILKITKQVTPSSWQSMFVRDLYFEDKVYHGNFDKGKPTVLLGVDDAFNSAEDSPFIIPFHETVLNSMSIVDFTEASINGTFMLCNAYKTVEYEVKDGGFLSVVIAIVVVVIAVVVSVYAPYLAPSMAAAAGSTGAAMGLTGTAALVAGAAVNAIAGMVISMMITEIATGVFGQKLGSIVGAIVSYVAMNFAASSMSGTQSVFSSAEKMFSASNVLAVTSSVGKGWQGYNQGVAMDIQTDIQKVMAESQKMHKSFESKLLDVQNQFSELLGTNKGVVNTLELTSTFGLTQDPTENRSLFLQRTLLTGSEIADITNGYITNFVESNMNLKNAIVGD